MDSQRLASRGMPIPRRVKYLSESELPQDISSSVGGTIYSTTPGGSRIIYERSALLGMRNSPVASTPPRDLPYIPGVSKGVTKDIETNKQTASPHKNHSPTLAKAKESDLDKKIPEEDDTEFEMEL